MIPIQSFISSFQTWKSSLSSTDSEPEIIRLYSLELSTVRDFLINKFSELTNIFNKFNNSSFLKFCANSTFTEYKNTEIVFSKNEKSSQYLLWAYGDINCYDGWEMEKTNVLWKTISAGKIYGDKIKDSYRFYGRARGRAMVIAIDKDKFDETIVTLNKEKMKFKLGFLKKFFPNLRLYSDDVLNTLLKFFIREEYDDKAKVFTDGEFDEFVYLIVKGEVGVAKKTNKFLDKLEGGWSSNTLPQNGYLLLEKFRRGDVFGGYSALGQNKCNYTSIALSNGTEVYKISKSHLLYYFGGNSGFIPKTIKSIDHFQQISHNLKLNYIREGMKNDKFIEKITILPEAHGNNNKKVIDESEIQNCLFEAWKSLDNWDNKWAAFKDGLLKGNAKKEPVDIFSEVKTQTEAKDFTKISGDATNRVVGRKLQFGWNSGQLKSIGTLNSICGVKKTETEDKLKEIAKIGSKLEGKKNKLMNFDEGWVNAIKEKEKNNPNIETERIAGDITNNINTINTEVLKVNNEGLKTQQTPAPMPQPQPQVQDQSKARKINRPSLRNLIE